MIDELLAPIAEENPAGQDLRSGQEWILIAEARHAGSVFSRDEWGAVDDTGSRVSGTWDPYGEPAGPDWNAVRRLTHDCLASRSKDLRLAIWFTEANFRIEELRGLSEGLHLIRELVDRFWNCGLYPEIEEDDVQWRTAPLEWLGPKLQAALLGLTIARDSGGTHSYRELLQPARTSDTDRLNAVHDAIRNTNPGFYTAFLVDLDACVVELSELQASLDRLCGAAAPVLSTTISILQELRAHLTKWAAPMYEPTPALKEEQVQDVSSFAPAPAGPVSVPKNPEARWERIAFLLSAGEIRQAMEQAEALAAQEPSGRERFCRRLALAEACLTQDLSVATEMLEQLAETMEELKLTTWESPELLVRVWQGLVTCYQYAPAGTPAAERYSYVFKKLCRLAPWRAIRNPT